MNSKNKQELIIGIIVLIFLIILVYTLNMDSACCKKYRYPIPPAIIVPITVKPKQYYNGGSTMAYFIENDQAPNLVFQRNVPITFNFTNYSHPLYFTLSNTGMDYENGISGIISEPITKPTTVYFDESIPSIFYYQCALHEKMGGIIRLI